jgi:hypothetical protein
LERPNISDLKDQGFLLIVATLCLSACAGKSTAADTARREQALTALRGAYAAFNRGDIDAAVEALDPQIEWTEPKEFPGGGAYHGREAVKQYLRQSRAAWAEVTSQPEQFVISDDCIVVFVHARVRARGSGEWQDVRLADVYKFRDGKAVEMHAFADRKQALAWAGVDTDRC